MRQTRKSRWLDRIDACHFVLLDKRTGVFLSTDSLSAFPGL